MEIGSELTLRTVLRTLGHGNHDGNQGPGGVVSLDRRRGGCAGADRRQARAVVLVSEEDWSAMQETLFLLSVPGMRESIRKGLRTPVGKCKTELRW